MNCRSLCAACCIYPSISSYIPGMPDGKPAMIPCIQLDDDLNCKLFGKPERPAVCVGFKPEPEFCGKTSREAEEIFLALLDVRSCRN